MLKVENEEWYKFTTADGKNNIEKLEDEPGLVSLDLINDDFAYPIKTIQNEYINNRILDIKEYLWDGRKDESNGFYIELDNHQGFSMFDKDGYLILSDGIIMEKGYALSNYR